MNLYVSLKLIIKSVGHICRVVIYFDGSGEISVNSVMIVSKVIFQWKYCKYWVMLCWMRSYVDLATFLAYMLSYDCTIWSIFYVLVLS